MLRVVLEGLFNFDLKHLHWPFRYRLCCGKSLTLWPSTLTLDAHLKGLQLIEVCSLSNLFETGFPYFTRSPSCGETFASLPQTQRMAGGEGCPVWRDNAKVMEPGEAALRTELWRYGCSRLIGSHHASCLLHARRVSALFVPCVTLLNLASVRPALFEHLEAGS